jgi:hypothetical protein
MELETLDFEKTKEQQKVLNEELDVKSKRLVEIANNLEDKFIVEALMLLASMQCSYKQIGTLENVAILNSLGSSIKIIEKAYNTHIHKYPTGETTEAIIKEK